MTTLSSSQLQHLDTLLQQEGGAPVFAAHGLLTALNCYSHVLPIENWLPILWGEERSFSNWQEMADLFSALGELNQMVAANTQLIPLVDYTPHITFNFNKLNDEQKEHCLQWCAGFVQGLSYDMAFWTADSDEKVLNAIMAIGAVAEQCQDFTDYDEEDDEDYDEDYEDEDLEELTDEDDEEFDFEIESEDDLFDDLLWPANRVHQLHSQRFVLGVEVWRQRRKR